MATQFRIVQVNSRGKKLSGGGADPWIDTGLTISSNQRLTIAAGGRVHLYVVGATWAMPWVGPEGCASFGPGGECSLFGSWNGQTLVGQPAGRLIGKIGTGSPFSVGKFHDKTVTGTGKLYLAVNDLTGFYFDNRGGFTALVAIDAPGVPLHDGDCPFCHDASQSTINPIKLQSGDKVWSGTDLKVETPAGSLAFTRSYTQSKQNHSEYQFMGLGWSHNHAYKLTLSGTSPARNAEVYLPEGGSLKLIETSANHFDASAGSTSVLDYNTTNAEYILTAQDKSQLAFDGTTLRLKRRAWPTGESWTYTYYVPADGADLDGKLKQIDDGYGRSLQFGYIRDTDPNPFQRRQLWRVGDQTAAGLNTATPSGRYVQLQYVQEKLNGAAVNGAQALLQRVTDVRGKNWDYDYYGQTAAVGQTDVKQLNFLLKRLSPTVDTSGDQTDDGSLTLEEVSYTLKSLSASSTPPEIINPDMEIDANWNGVGSPPINQRSTAQVDSGTYSRYAESSALGQGIESDDWNLIPGRVYVITARVYPLAGRVKMQIQNTVVADESQNGTAAWETLRLVYSPSGEKQTRRIQFITSAMPGSGNAKVYVDSVTVSRIKTMQQKRGDAQLVTDLVFAPEDANLIEINQTTETVQGKTTTHYFANGVYVGPANPANELSVQAIGTDYRPASAADGRGNTTQLDWVNNGKLLTGLADPLGQDTSFGYDSSDRLISSVDAQGRKTIYVYDAANRQPTMVLVDDVNNLAVNGSMELDSNWTNVGTPTSNQRTPAAQTGSYLRHVVAAAAGQGMEGNTWDLEVGHTYTITAQVYLVAGSLKMQVSGTTAFDQIASATGVWTTLKAVHTPTSALSNNKVQFIANGAAAEFYVDSVSIIKSGIDLAVNGGMELDSSWASVGTPSTNERSTGQVDSGIYSRHIVTSALDQGIEGNAWDIVNLTNGQIYTITARVYPVSGVVKMQIPGLTDANSEKKTSGTGNWQTLQYIHLASANGTGYKVRFVSTGAAEFYVDSVSIVKADAELSQNGDMEADDTWASIGTPTIQEQMIGANTGSYARRLIASAAGQGIEGAAWNMVANRTYFITARVYPVSGTVKMQVTGTSAFDKSTVGTGSWQTLRATYKPTAAAASQKLQFIASGAAAEFYVDSVAITEVGADLVVNGSMELDSDWTNVGTPTTNQRSTTQVDSGTYSRRLVASAAGQGIEGNAWDWVANRTYVVMARVYPVSGVAKMQVTGTTAFDKSTSGTGSWQHLRAVYTPTSNATGKKIQFIASGGAAEFYVDSVHIVDVSKLLQWQEFRYDSKGRSLLEARLDPATASVQQQTSRTYGLSGTNNGLLESLVQTDPLNPGNTTSTIYTYDSAGRVVKTQQTSLFGTCQFFYTVYDAAGNVVATVCSLENVTAPTTVTAAKAMYVPADPDKNKVTTYDYDALGRRIQTTTDAGAGFLYTVPGTGFAQATLTFYDALDRVKRTITNYRNQSAGANESSGDWVWSVLRKRWEKGASDSTPITFGADNTQNIISDTTYNKRGMLKSQRDALGHLNLYGYDDAGRLVKTIQNASQDPYNNDYDGDPSLANYVPIQNADQDIITTQSYDAAGNLIKSVDALGSVNYTIYDALNRPVKTIRAAKDTATLELGPGESNYSAAFDPRSDGYVPSNSPDRDLIETTEYDSLGRVIRSKRLLDSRALKKWETTLYGYDTLGRQVVVIRNASSPDYKVTADPGLASYVINADPDRDMVTRTAYDSAGRVMYTEDALGARTWIAYDGLGRQVKTIASAVGTATDGGVNDPRSASYVPSSAADKDLITTTVYDVDGRVQSTQDALGRVSRNVYDSRGRVTRSISNYLVQGTTNPKDWVWNASSNRWEYGAANTTPVSHGTDNDQNIISDTLYDVRGRVSQTIDNRHNTTWQVYDELGRRLKTVVNASADPTNWVWDAVDGRWEDGSNNAISFGADKDQNRITTTSYDLLGRVTNSRDAAGLETYLVYDALGRRLKTIENYKVQGSSIPANWLWSTANQCWENGAGAAIDHSGTGSINDQNRISSSDYNKAGQILATRDARGTQTTFIYDKAGRRLIVTQAANSPLVSLAYTCYDKAGRVLRTIQNWSNNLNKPMPDAMDTKGNWLFVPDHNGQYNDRDLVTTYLLDNVGRPVQMLDPMGNQTLMGYDKDGQARWTIDPEYSVSQYRYDSVRRRTRVVQGYLPVQATADARIIFSTNRDGNYEIYKANTDGTSPVNLTAYPGADDLNPAWSPDGSKIVFMSVRTGLNDLHTMNADGSTVQRLSTLTNASDNQILYPDFPAWSPDGGQIAFRYQALNGKFAIGVLNADGTNFRVVYNDAVLNGGAPAWSPDGQRLVFHAGTDLSIAGDIYVIRVDGSQLANLTNNSAGLNLFPFWSPDGSKIAFQAKRGSNREVYVMNADGSNIVNLSNYASADDFTPSWSPDGQFILFHSERDGDAEIFRMNADGSGQTQLSTNTAIDKIARWSPKVVNPAAWVWNDTVGFKRWEDGSGNALPHGANNDRNIIVDVTYDKGGRVRTQRDPGGNVTLYDPDLLDRRKKLTSPLSTIANPIEWKSTYADLTNGRSQMTMRYPGITGSPNYDVIREFDRLGRPKNIQYGSPAATPDVVFGYDDAGNRAKMSEYAAAGFTSRNRETNFTYDSLHRLESVVFDNNGDGTPDETVSYQYDVGGLRTKLTLPGSLNVVYSYDQRGQLLSLTDWDNQKTQMAYDLAGRQIATDRANGLRSRYHFDAGGRLRILRHTREGRIRYKFPNLGYLDFFNRANGALGSSWSGTTGGYSILSNQVDVGTGGDIYWAGSSFGADQEAFVTLSTIDAASTEIDLLLKAQSALWSNGVIKVMYKPSTGKVQVWTYDGTWVQRGSDITVTFAAGDQFGARALAEGKVEVYKNQVLLGICDTSGWTLNANGGSIGLWLIGSSNSVLDNFGGGTFSAPAKLSTTAAHFEYQVDKRGNRTQAFEAIANPATLSNTVIPYSDKSLVLNGSWATVGSFKESTQSAASLKLAFLGDEATLTMGTGPDHGIYDVFINGALWQSFDGYAASAGQTSILISAGVDSRRLQSEGPHVLEIRNRAEKNRTASGYKVRFNQLVVSSRTWHMQTVSYSYDKLSRLLEARHAPGVNAAAVDADLLRRYLYTYDRAGNRLSESLAINGAAPTVVSRTYNAANQISSAGYTYDNNGNLTNDGTNAYTWDRANRMTGVGSYNFAYDGLGNRFRQVASSIPTDYLLDLQPGLAVVLRDTYSPGNEKRYYVHGPRGLMAEKYQTSPWEWTVQDGLGSIRTRVNFNASDTVLDNRNYSPYGETYDDAGYLSWYGFTGEWQATNYKQVHLRARNYNTGMGAFTSQDLLESLNRYVYASGNPINRVDRNGLQDFPDNYCIPIFNFDGTTSSNCINNGQGGNNGFGGLILQVPGNNDWKRLFTIGGSGNSGNQTVDDYFRKSYPQPGGFVGLTETCLTNPDFCDLANGIPTTLNPPISIPTNGKIGGGIGIPEWLLKLLGGCLELLKWLQLIKALTDAIPAERDRDDEDCNNGMLDAAAAEEYARIAKYEYYDQIALNQKNPPITVAVTRAKDISGNCVEFVSASNASGKETVRSNGDLRMRGIRAINALGAVVTVAGLRGAIPVGFGSTLIEYIAGIQGHAETNLYYNVPQPQSVRAIGVSQFPCPDCQTFLNTVPVVVAYYDVLAGGIRVISK
ncbi:MAG: RHS repeat-associated core domain-containing protein [Anaerolineae bacterium]